jgi:hypothetical protein
MEGTFNQSLKKRIMRRVYAIWFLRRTAPVLAAMPFSLAVALWLTAKEFFVAKIVENFTISLHSGNVFDFIGSAFYNTSHLSSVAIVGFLSILFLVLGYKLFRNFTQLTLVRI